MNFTTSEKKIRSISVQKAYEHFMLVCELTKENNE